MALNFEGLPQLFKHSKAFSQGLGKERKGAGEIVVAQDGTGDFDTIEEAIKTIPKGGSIFLKDGIYILKNTLIIPSNTIIRGESHAAIIKTATGKDLWISLSGKSNIWIENLTFYLFFGLDTGGIINTGGSNSCTFKNINFKFGNTDVDVSLFIDLGSASTKLKILNCVADTTEGNLFSIIDSCSKAQIIDNRFDTLDQVAWDGNITNCVFKGNFLRNLGFNEGDNNNIAIGNQTDNAITDTGAGNQIANNVVF